MTEDEFRVEVLRVLNLILVELVKFNEEEMMPPEVADEELKLALTRLGVRFPAHDLGVPGDEEDFRRFIA